MNTGSPIDGMCGGQKPALITKNGIPRKRKSVTFDDTASAPYAHDSDYHNESTHATPTVISQSIKGIHKKKKHSRPKKELDASGTPTNVLSNCDLLDQRDSMNQLILQLGQSIPKMHDQYKTVTEAYQHCCISLQEIFQTLKEHREAEINKPPSPAANNLPSFELGQDHNRSNVGDNSPEPPNKKCKERSKLTLKHPENGRGLEELAEETGVFVNSIKLKKCRGSSRNGMELALGLMQLVFSYRALRECSLFQDKSQRIPLDRTAVDAIMDYVKQHGRDMKWVIDDSTIEKSMKTKLQNNRYR